MGVVVAIAVLMLVVLRVRQWLCVLLLMGEVEERAALLSEKCHTLGLWMILRNLRRRVPGEQQCGSRKVCG